MFDPLRKSDILLLNSCYCKSALSCARFSSIQNRLALTSDAPKASSITLKCGLEIDLMILDHMSCRCHKLKLKIGIFFSIIVTHTTRWDLINNQISHFLIFFYCESTGLKYWITSFSFFTNSLERTSGKSYISTTYVHMLVSGGPH